MHEPFKTRDRLPGNRKPTVHVTVGCSRCGKTSWANNHRKMLDATILGGDDIRRALNVDRYNADVEPRVGSILQIAVDALLHRGQNVIIEETNLTEVDRFRWMQIAQGGLAELTWVTFENPPIEEWRARAARADFPWSIIEHQQRIYQPLQEWEVDGIGVIDGSRG